MAPLTAAIVFADTLTSFASNVFSRIALGVILSIVAGLVWPVTWALWVFQLISGRDNALLRVAALLNIT
jgi:hypothetical protein